MSSQAEDKEINKTIRNLRFCSRHGLYSKRNDGKGFDYEGGSQTGKNKFCHICNRNKATKMGLRISSFLKDSQTLKDIEGLYFYHITFTLRHTKDVRNYVYLDELKRYMVKLFGRKIWKDYFRSEKNWGDIVSYENSIKTDHHIHAHSLVMAGRLTKRVNVVQAELREAWKNITGDSTGIDIQLVRAKDLHSKIQEIVKYPLKLDDKNYSTYPQEKIELICDWVRTIKGKKFTNAHGYFRGSEITTKDSKWDEVREAREYKPDTKYFIDRIARVWLSIPKGRGLDKEQREKYFKRVVEEIVITRLSPEAIEVTDHLEYAKDLLGIETLEEMRLYIESLDSNTRPFGDFDEDGFTIPMDKDRIKEMVRIGDLNGATIRKNVV